MPALTLAQLLTPQTRDIIRASLITALGTAGFPTDDWAPSSAGGVENAAVDMTAGVLALRAAPKIATLIALRLLERSSGDALKYLAQHFYELTPIGASKTIQNMVLIAAASARAETFQPGDLIAVGPGGNHYRNTGVVTANPGGGVTGEDTNYPAEADEAGASFDDPEGTVRLVTAPAGMFAVNRAPLRYAEGPLTGGSSGTVGVRIITTGVAGLTYPDIVRVRIDTDGDVGTATWSLSLDDGVTWTGRGPVPTHFDLGFPEGIQITFANGAGTPSFEGSDIFTFFRQRHILQQGRDPETDDDLKRRCRFRWLSLADIPTGGLVELWAKLASPEVERVIVDADPATPGGVFIVLASSSGPASAAAIAAVQTFVEQHLQYKKLTGIGAGVNSAAERALARSATPRAISGKATVFYHRGHRDEVQGAADTLWREYLRTVPIAGLIELAKFIEVLMDAGAEHVDVDTATINGNNGNVQLFQLEVAQASGSLASTCAWKAV